MSKNISLLGADYPDVPQVVLPQTGGGTAAFTDVSDSTVTAADVAAGKVFYTASGERKTGTLEVGNVRMWYGASSTEALTRDKEVTISGYDAYRAGDLVIVIFAAAQDYNGAPRLNINGLGVKNIRRVSGTNAMRYIWQAGQAVAMIYDGSNFVIINGALAGTTYYGITRLNASATGTSNGLGLTVSGLNAYSERMITGLPVYSADATYAVGDRVRYSWYVYRCKTAITTPESWNADHWEQLPSLLEMIDDLYRQI